MYVKITVIRKIVIAEGVFKYCCETVVDNWESISVDAGTIFSRKII